MDEMLAKKIGRCVRRARLARRWTQEDAAERMNLSAAFDGRIERGMAIPSVPILFRMVSTLDIPGDSLFRCDGGATAADTQHPQLLVSIQGLPDAGR